MCSFPVVTPSALTVDRYHHRQNISFRLRVKAHQGSSVIYASAYLHVITNATELSARVYDTKALGTSVDISYTYNVRITLVRHIIKQPTKRPNEGTTLGTAVNVPSENTNSSREADQLSRECTMSEDGSLARPHTQPVTPAFPVPAVSPAVSPATFTLHRVHSAVTRSKSRARTPRTRHRTGHTQAAPRALTFHSPRQQAPTASITRATSKASRYPFNFSATSRRGSASGSSEHERAARQDKSQVSAGQGSRGGTAARRH